jgi:hypothetical protein
MELQFYYGYCFAGTISKLMNEILTQNKTHRISELANFLENRTRTDVGVSKAKSIFSGDFPIINGTVCTVGPSGSL